MFQTCQRAGCLQTFRMGAHPGPPCSSTPGFFLALWAAFVFATTAVPTQSAEALANPAAGSTTNAAGPYEFRSIHSRDGIGKFYQGREIAHVMGHQAADWLERPEREEEEHTTKLVEQLKLRPGDVVADIGAGTGYFSRRLAARVGPSGSVLAVDIQPEMLELLRQKMSEAGVSNVTPVLGTVNDPHLPTNAVDLALMVDVYHEFDFPAEMMAAIVASLKPGGRVVLVEFRGEDPLVPIKLLHKMTEAQVRKELAGLPVQWVETIGVLPHIIVFRRNAPAPFRKPGAP